MNLIFCACLKASGMKFCTQTALIDAKQAYAGEPVLGFTEPSQA